MWSFTTYLLLALFMAYVAFTVLILTLVHNNAVKWGVWGGATGGIILIGVLVLCFGRGRTSTESEAALKRDTMKTYWDSRQAANDETQAHREACIARAVQANRQDKANGVREGEADATQRLAIDDCIINTRSDNSGKTLAAEVAACKAALSATGQVTTLRTVEDLERRGEIRNASTTCGVTLPHGPMQM